MGLTGEKWFSMRTDFFGNDSYTLGVFDLSAPALGAYVASIAHVCRYGIGWTHGGVIRMAVGPRRSKAVIDELVAAGMLTHLPPIGQAPNPLKVEHEGKLWVRSKPLTRRAIPDRIRDAVMERDERTCVQCGATEDLSLDHIHPYSLGGRDTIENLRVLCRSCNSSKGARV